MFTTHYVPGVVWITSLGGEGHAEVSRKRSQLNDLGPEKGAGEIAASRTPRGRERPQHTQVLVDEILKYGEEQPALSESANSSHGAD